MSRARTAIVVLLLAGALPGAISMRAEASGPGYLNVSQDAVANNTEPYVAVDPSNPQHVAVGFMKKPAEQDIEAIQCWVAVTFDGGSTWTRQQIGGDQEHTCADPSLAFGPGGVLYFARTAYIGPDAGQVYLQKSLDGGLTWSAPVVVYDATEQTGTFDRPWVAVDNSGGPHEGRVYVVSMTFFPIPNPHIYLRSSDDGGDTFSAPVQVDGGQYLGGGAWPSHIVATETMAIGADGEILVAYRTDGTCTQYCFADAVSTDGGQTFQQYLLAVPTLAAGVSDSNDADPTAIVTADPLNPGHFAAVWMDTRFSGGQEFDLAAATTTDGGLTWSPPVKVNDGPIIPHSAQDHPWLGYAPNDDLVVIWRDHRNGGTPTTGQGSMDLYGAVSSDNGTTFQPNVRLSPASAPFFAESAGDDFDGMAIASDGTVYSAWAVLANGNKDVWLSVWDPWS